MFAPEARVRIGAQTAVGRVREHNEDSLGSRPEIGLAVVCDGMGGHERGEVASALAVQTIIELIAQAPAPPDHEAAAELLATAVHEANALVHSAGRTSAAALRMGTTVVALWVIAGHAIVVHVGDSRCYMLRGKALQRLTADHTFLEDARRHELGEAVDDAMRLHFAHVLTRSVGNAPGCMLDMASCPLVRGDRFLLCSDGLTGMIDDGMIAAILAESESPEHAATRLIAAANERGGHDNITAVVVWANA